MHLAMEAEGDVLAVGIADTVTGDSSGLDLLLPQVGEINPLIVDTAYCQIDRNEQLLASGVVPVLPPRCGAVDDPNQNRWHDQLARYLKDKGHYAFQNKYGYGLRARVEAQFSRIKRCLGDVLLTRRMASQVQEGRVIANLHAINHQQDTAHSTPSFSTHRYPSLSLLASFTRRIRQVLPWHRNPQFFVHGDHHANYKSLSDRLAKI
jgi:hypothetical protein